MWSIIGLDTLLLDFLWGHPNSLNWPIKSSGPNCVCVMWYIWIYLFIYIYIYIYIHKGKRKASVLFYFLLRAERARTTNSSEHTQRLNLGVEREKLIEPEFSHHHKLNVFLDTSGAWKWLSMGLIKVNISSIALLLHALMSAYDPMWFKLFHHVWLYP